MIRTLAQIEHASMFQTLGLSSFLHSSPMYSFMKRHSTPSLRHLFK